MALESVLGQALSRNKARLVAHLVAPWDALLVSWEAHEKVDLWKEREIQASGHVEQTERWPRSVECKAGVKRKNNKNALNIL